MTFRIKDHEDFTNPINADTEEEAAKKAIKIMHFGYETRNRVKKVGALTVLTELGFALVMVL